MASSSSQNNHNAFNLNVVPSIEPKVRRPYFLSPNGPVTVIDSVMLSGTTATAVAVGLLTLEDGWALAGRTDPQTIKDSTALIIQATDFQPTNWNLPFHPLKLVTSKIISTSPNLDTITNYVSVTFILQYTILTTHRVSSLLVMSRAWAPLVWIFFLETCGLLDFSFSFSSGLFINIY